MIVYSSVINDDFALPASTLGCLVERTDYYK